MSENPALVMTRHGEAMDPKDIARFLDDQGDRACEAIGSGLYDAADVVRGLSDKLAVATARATKAEAEMEALLKQTEGAQR